MAYRLRATSRGLLTLARLQWQPTLTVHDPNPPLTLEDAAAAAAGQPMFRRYGGVPHTALGGEKHSGVWG